MPSLVELMDNVLHIIQQSDLQNLQHKNMTANYMVEVLLDMFEGCKHVWEDAPNDAGMHLDDNGECFTNIRCSKCYTKRKKYWMIKEIV